MNMLKKGPELKMPDVKVPTFLLDVYYDLRERHLLPLVAILVVALVALPFLIGGGSSESESEEAESAIATPSVVSASKLVVAKSAPGLRDYHHRLREGRAKDPFVQHYAESEAGEGGGSEGSAGGEGSTVTVESSESSETSIESTETTSPSEGSGEPPEESGLRYYSWAIDVRVVPVSSGKGKDKPEASVRHDLPGMTMLPSRSVPAMTFIGVTKDEKNAVMLVSDKVTGLFGDGVCIAGSEHCQLIVLEPGIPETVVYGANSRTYRIELLKIRLLKTDKLNVAPTGKPKQGTDGRPQLAPLVAQPR
jgi:hypothetical protein